MAAQTETKDRYPCQCCGFLTLSDPATGSYEICPLCRWEDDQVQNGDPEYAGGANKVSLGAARENYIRFGAKDQASVRHARPALIEEVPHPAVVQGLDEKERATILRRLKTTLLGVVRAMLSGHIPVIEGCAAVSAVASPLNDIEVEDQLRLLIGVASEADNFPVGATRQLWAPDALAAQDQSAAEYAQRVEGPVKKACARLEQYLRADLDR